MEPWILNPHLISFTKVANAVVWNNYLIDYVLQVQNPLSETMQQQVEQDIYRLFLVLSSLTDMKYAAQYLKLSNTVNEMYLKSDK